MSPRSLEREFTWKIEREAKEGDQPSRSLDSAFSHSTTGSIVYKQQQHSPSSFIATYITHNLLVLQPVLPHSKFLYLPQ